MRQFSVGEVVTWIPDLLLRSETRGDYRIVAEMPDRVGDYIYRIKSPLEEYERVVKESLLVKSQGVFAGRTCRRKIAPSFGHAAYSATFREQKIEPSSTCALKLIGERAVFQAATGDSKLDLAEVSLEFCDIRAQNEQMFSGVPPIADIARRGTSSMTQILARPWESRRTRG